MVQFLENEHHSRRAIPLPAVGHSGQTLSGPTAHLVEALVILDRVLGGYPCINIHFSEKEKIKYSMIFRSLPIKKEL